MRSQEKFSEEISPDINAKAPHWNLDAFAEKISRIHIHGKMEMITICIMDFSSRNFVWDFTVGNVEKIFRKNFLVEFHLE